MKMPGPVRLLADDLTGALDSAAAFGAGVPVHLDRPGPTDGDASTVSVVATATRDVALARLPGLLEDSVPWLATAGVAFKKVDSLLRGNSLAEVRWLLTAAGFERLVFAPAFPTQGRFTLGERLALAAPGVAPDHAEARGDNLRQALLARPWPTGCELVLPEVRSDDDLDRLTVNLDRPERRTLWCGSAGLAAAVARRLNLHAGEADQPVPPPGPIWVVGASHQPVSRRQWARAAAVCTDAVIVRHGDEATLHHVLSTLAKDAAGVVLMDLAPLVSMDSAAAATLLHSQAARLAALPHPPARLLVVGGDTARALARACGVTSFVSGRPSRPGWGRARWCGGRWHGLWMDCRSGAFGDDDDLLDAIGATAGQDPRTAS